MVAGIVLTVSGAAVALSGVLALTGRLTRNRWAGVRTSATMRNDQAFAVGNRAAGPAVLAGGIVAVVCGVIALVWPGNAEAAWVLAGAAVMVVLVVAGGVRGDRAARGA